MNSKEFAKLIGVSQSTVSRALNNSNLVPEEKRKYIIQKAKEHGFVLNSQAKSLRTSRTGTIGILLPRFFVGLSRNLTISELYDELQTCFRKLGYDTLLVNYVVEQDDYSSFERIVRNRKVDGFVVLRMELSDKELSLIEEYNIPVIFIMNPSSRVRENLNYVFSDSINGGYQAGKFLGGFPEWEHFFVKVKEETNDARRRLEGYRKGLEECQIPLPEENVLECSISIESAYQLILDNKDRLIGKKSAIFAYSDLIAIGVRNACQTLGLRIPEDVQIIGMDGMHLSYELHPQLSTIKVPIREMSQIGSEALVKMILHEEVKVHTWLKPQLTLRETTL